MSEKVKPTVLALAKEAGLIVGLGYRKPTTVDENRALELAFLEGFLEGASVTSGGDAL